MSSSVNPGWTFLRSKRWIGFWVLLAIFSVACVLLGNWQFARRAEARAEIARIDANYDARPVKLTEALPTPDAFEEDAHKWLPVTVSGNYLTEQQMLVRNRPFESKIGFNLLVPFQLENGDVFIVDRGWVPAGETADTPAEIPAPPEGTVTVTARLKAGEPVIPGRTASEVDGGIVSLGTINLEEIQATLQRPAYTGAYGLLIEEEPSAQSGQLAIRPERDEGPHLSYALQWYVFILIAVAGTLYGARMEFRALNPDSSAVRERDAKRKARKARKRPSDAESEDAYLDARESQRSSDSRSSDIR